MRFGEISLRGTVVLCLLLAACEEPQEEGPPSPWQGDYALIWECPAGGCITRLAICEAAEIVTDASLIYLCGEDFALEHVTRGAFGIAADPKIEVKVMDFDANGIPTAWRGCAFDGMSCVNAVRIQ